MSPAPSPPPQMDRQPNVMRTQAWPDYALIDSGDGRKLERYGPYRVIRPEPQCLWRPRLSAEEWERADAVFDPSDEDEAGHWRQNRPVPASWPMQWEDVRFSGRLTAFRHLGVFPEQAANWAWLKQRVRAAPAPARVLNLFGYTGLASLACAAAGAAVTHLDASKKAIGWARENAALSGLGEHPIRWLCEDARRYVEREVRRGSQYEGIILDPPKYGRGPTGEVWRMLENLPEFIRLCVSLLSDKAEFLLINAYAVRLSGLALGHLLTEAFEGRGGAVEWGELALEEEGGGREIGVSFFARWTRP